MTTEQEAIKQRLEEELQDIHFTSYDQVLKQTHPPNFGARLLALWNKELEIPVKPIAAISMVVLVLTLTSTPFKIKDSPNKSVPQSGQRELIVAGGNTYWKDIYEQAVKRHEN